MATAKLRGLLIRHYAEHTMVTYLGIGMAGGGVSGALYAATSNDSLSRTIAETIVGVPMGALCGGIAGMGLWLSAPFIPFVGVVYGLRKCMKKK